MADVFLSYARGDQPRAEKIAAAIEQAGRSVWWDRHLVGGHEFSRDIESALADARHVLVLWSKEAVQSRWVRDEASEGAERASLVSATIDGTLPPLGFRQFHTVDLSGWTDGDPLPDGLAVALGLIDNEAAHPHAEPAPATRSKRPLAWAVGALAGLAAIGGITYVAAPGLFGGASARADGARVAILPFAVAGDEAQAYLGRGVAAAIVDGLAGLEGLSMPTTTSTFAIASEGLTAAAMAGRLDVDHLVEGDVRIIGDQVTLTARLVDPQADTPLWSNSVSGELHKLPTLQRELTASLAAALQARLGVGSGDWRAASDEVDPEAYDYYLRGVERLHSAFNANDYAEAYRHFARALERQEDFADAHALKAMAMLWTGPQTLSLSPDAFRREMRAATDRALELDPDNRLGQIARAGLLYRDEGRVSEALAILQSLVDKDPDFALAQAELARVKLVAGDAEGAFAHFQRARQLDPTNIYFQVGGAHARYFTGDYDFVRQEAADCSSDCTTILTAWLAAIAALANASDARRDIPVVLERLREDQGEAPDAFFARWENRLESMTLGVPNTDPDGTCRPGSYYAVAYCARTVSPDRALDMLDAVAQNEAPDNIIRILNDSRMSLPVEARADPRYHDFVKRHPAIARIIDYRRKNGVLAGLPIAPDEIAKEKARLAAKGF
ncbi:TIR domain-containing protein [Sphingomicrobium nitratireducens]|uniref:TIR domain-containing protein n=1 Tax=Sphingomicrobium nitratireducens TaxID=2964666 RepID=UPI00223F1782|nr:TIR domain-containing protein [Sphingomicrobium nitratireducens]